jgi:hypothetical protein
MASSGWVADRFAAAPPDSAAKFRWRRAHGHGEGLRHWERARAGSERHVGLSHGHDIDAEAPEGADHGRAAQWRCKLAPMSNRAKTRATNREIGARGGCSH